MFQQLVESRHRLQEFCKLHYHSVDHFSGGLSFAIYRAEIDLKEFGPTDTKHLTSSATCYSSLLECPERFKPDDARDTVALAKDYAAAALNRQEWTSDGSAPIYCRCRTLPFVIKHVAVWQVSIEGHIQAILEQMNQPGRFGVGEADPPDEPNKWYRPNAYHTYWTLELLESFKLRFPEQFSKANVRLDIEKHIAQMRQWARECLGYQVSLHSANSTLLDSDQLAWALAIVTRSPSSFASSPAEQDFIKHGFKCLFATQKNNGSWQHYAPLFHYLKTGNAYCYVFESFAELLRHALSTGAEFIRTTLRENFAELMKLWAYAESVQVVVDGVGKKVIWSSGHRTNNIHPESWATASVFAYAQGLRRLLGVWTREEALTVLPRRTPYSSQKSAMEALNQRTKTWTSTNQLTDQLKSMFVNPAASKTFDKLEPDNLPIDEDSARSAILYGPPGASKTTIVRALAGVIGWDYVELHASHFVSDGLPNVQRKADEIFSALMELDHAIVLFDEIDELVREREGESDAFGRFLTTSMLPKLAELWKSRKIMYFVASNHISYFDRAITRSERFDAVIFVSPPSFEAKTGELRRLFSERHGRSIEFAFSKSDIDAAFPAFSGNEDFKDLAKKALLPENMLAKFALMRWDELAELGQLLNEIVPIGEGVSQQMLAEALAKVKDEMWRTQREYFEYWKDPKYERRDFSKTRLWDLRQS